ncbi:A disintegrin and metalloproteinase with thrombospondin motifs 20-like [Cyprinus carpio]|uniref:A disintegrin and metalloproteinase with thrombospondin motifs 20-like n=1 Tax=Cyprinus carpio TaxID=7962 RepID=A0A9R0ARM3_CYPCA|nr:A disintegrin and metalloproteinase with thrombospondin motifs 20-like [Cyprinus carpio]
MRAPALRLLGLVWHLSALLRTAQTYKLHHKQESFIRQLSAYEIITPVRLNDFGESFPHRLHYRRRRRSADVEVSGSRAHYRFEAFGQAFQLNLTADSGFIAPSYTVLHLGEEEKRGDTADLRHCFFRGHVNDRKEHHAVFSLCTGLIGTFTTHSGQFFLEPLLSADGYEYEEEHNKPHLLYRHESHDSQPCSTSDHPVHHISLHSNRTLEEEVMWTQETMRRRAARSEGGSRSRRKRFLSYPRFVELMVTADAKMVRHHGRNLEHYILTIMSVVAAIYRDPSVGNLINIMIVKLIVIHNEQEGPNINFYATATLHNFCMWQQSHNVLDDSHPGHHDTALLITREDICRAKDKCDTLGLAELGTMCDPYRSCSISEENGLSASFTIAHELGHVFNMPHDDSPKCREAGIKHQYHVMAPTLNYDTSPWSWSKCSRKYITDFLDTGYGECLLDEPLVRMYNLPSQLPGQLYNANRQCELMFGPGSQVCPFMKQCKRLWCTSAKGDHKGCHTQHMPHADGTECGYGMSQITVLLRGDTDTVYRGTGMYSIPCYPSVTLMMSPDSTNGFEVSLQSTAEKRARIVCSRTYVEGKRSSSVRESSETTATSPEVKRPSTLDTPNKTPCEPINAPESVEPVDVEESFFAGYNVVVRIPAGATNIDIKQVLCVGNLYNPDVRYSFSIPIEEQREQFVWDLSGPWQECSRICQGATSVSGGGRPCVFVRVIIWWFDRGVRIYLRDPEAQQSPAILTSVNSGGTWRAGATVPIHWMFCASTTGCSALCMRLQPEQEAKLKHGGQDSVQTWPNTHTPEWMSWDLVCSRAGNGQHLFLSELQSGLSDACGQVCCCVGEAYGETVGTTTDVTQRSRQDPRDIVFGVRRGGAGRERLRASCRDTQGGVAEESSCAHLPRPPDSSVCFSPCGQWREGEWTPCSVSCGVGRSTRRVVCMSYHHQLDESFCDPDERPSAEQECAAAPCQSSYHWPNNQPHFPYDPSSHSWNVPSADNQWRTGPWGACSSSCEGGIQRRVVVCQDADGRSTNHCDERVKPDESKSCDSGPCPHWNHGIWGQVRHTTPAHSESCFWMTASGFPDGLLCLCLCLQCSVSCGKGVKERQIVCVDQNQTQIQEHSCAHLIPPRTQKACRAGPCPSWRANRWRECSVSCGAGLQSREVFCRSKGKGRVSDDLCDARVRPDHLRSCFHSDCQTHSWTTHDWKECNVSCGRGVRSRSVFCVDSGMKAAPDSMCDASLKPHTHEPCHSATCLYVWISTPWSQCSVSCGSGLQRRARHCSAVTSDLKTHSHTSEPQTTESPPADSRPCVLPECPSAGRWSTGPWSQCSQTCGAGVMHRTVQCLSAQNLPSQSCPLSSQPETHTTCRHTDCELHTSCREVQVKGGVRKDGEHYIKVRSKILQIYCAEMQSGFPKEYVTLRSGQTDNYSEVYGYRLQNPSECPYNGSRRLDCACRNDYTAAGYTVFHRVRLDLSSMRIIPTDLKFSQTLFGRSVPFASAGDCYSAAKCPQGQFSINLSGTGLKVAEFTKWVSQGNYGTVKVHRSEDGSRIYGRCGGYCGTCLPQTGLFVQIQ